MDDRTSRVRTLSRRSFMTLAAGGIVTVRAFSPLRSIAAQSSYEPGQPVNSTTVTFAGGTYVSEGGGKLYQYARDTTGTAYYNTYDGTAWSGWTGYDQQPSPSSYDVAPVSYNNASYAYYTGDNGYLYQQSWDASGAATWEDLSGGYTYGAAPYASVYEDTVHLYGASTDGNVYHKPYTGGTWGEWAPVNDPAVPAKADSRPYAVSWGDHDNVFWLGEDGYTYWNRYAYADGTWTGAKQIPSEYTFSCQPHAVGYQPESKLYAYSATLDGVPVSNSFDGSGWAGWQQYDTAWTASYQPNAYVYQDTQHIVYPAADGHAYYTTYAGGTYGQWEDLGANYGYDAYQYAYNDSLYLTYTGADGKIYTRTYAAAGGEPTPTPSY